MNLERLKKFAELKGFDVNMIDFGIDKECGFLFDNHIYVNKNSNVSKDRISYTLAHELAHGYLHKDKGNTRKSPKHAEYEEEADRAANMILDLLSMEFNSSSGGIN